MRKPELAKIANRILIVLVLGVVLLLVLSLNFYFKCDDFQMAQHFGSLKQAVLSRPLYKILNILPGNNYYLHNSISYLLHLLHAVVFYFFAQKLALYFRFIISKTLLLFGVVLSLLHGVASEVVFWTICKGTIAASIFAMLAVIAYINFTISAKKLHLMASVCSYLVGVFFYETTLLLPVVFIVFNYVHKVVDGGKIRLQAFAWLLLPATIYFFRIGLHEDFLINYGHKGLVEHTVFRLVFNLWHGLMRVLVPHFGLIVWLFIAVLVSGFLMVFFIKINKINKKQVLALLVIIVLLALPGATFGMAVHNSEGERLLYTTAPFVIFLLLFLLAQTQTKKRYVLLFAICILAINIYGFVIGRQRWQKASEISKSVAMQIKNIPQSDTLILLAIPDNINGALIFRDNKAKYICDFMHWKKNYQRMFVLSTFEMQSVVDSVWFDESAQTLHYPNRYFYLNIPDFKKLSIQYNISKNKQVLQMDASKLKNKKLAVINW